MAGRESLFPRRQPYLSPRRLLARSIRRRPRRLSVARRLLRLKLQQDVEPRARLLVSELLFRINLTDILFSRFSTKYPHANSKDGS